MRRNVALVSGEEALGVMLREQGAGVAAVRRAVRSRRVVRVGRWRLVDDGGRLVAVDTVARRRVVLAGGEEGGDGR